MSDARRCQAIVDHDEEFDVTCNEPAAFVRCGECLCHQCAHDWLDELEPNGVVHEVSALAN